MGDSGMQACAVEISAPSAYHDLLNLRDELSSAVSHLEDRISAVLTYADVPNTVESSPNGMSDIDNVIGEIGRTASRIRSISGRVVL